METGERYSDISIQTLNRIGIVLKLKCANDGNLKSACVEVLKQIEEKKCTECLKRQGMKQIMKYGIMFHEKECMVATA